MQLTHNYHNKNVLITGGTKGIGLAAAKTFAAAGAQCILTYKWGETNFDELKREFTDENLIAPLCIQADVSIDSDTDNLMQQMIQHNITTITTFISNVGFAPHMKTIEDYSKRSLFKSFEYSSWPIVEYTRYIKKYFGQYPQYIVGVSSNGPDHFYPGYDYIATSKALLEVFGKYLASHLQDENVKVNILRFGAVRTESFNFMFGEDFFQFMKKEGFSENIFVTLEQCGKAIFAVCSGLFDIMNGQIIELDNGITYLDNMMNRYHLQKNK